MGTTKPMRRIKENVWGNLNGYEGVRKVKEFGTDEIAAREWLQAIEPLPLEPLRLRDFDKEFKSSERPDRAGR